MMHPIIAIQVRVDQPLLYQAITIAVVRRKDGNPETKTYFDQPKSRMLFWQGAQKGMLTKEDK